MPYHDLNSAAGQYKKCFSRNIADLVIELTSMLDDLKLFTKSNKKTTFVISYRSTNYSDKIKFFTWKKEKQIFLKKWAGVLTQKWWYHMI